MRAKSANATTSKRFDYVVVGGGTAGCVVARRLAEDPSTSVCLIEAGPSDEGNEKVLQLARWPELLGGELDYDYRIEPQARGNGAIRHSRAKVLGGCSSHNSAIAFFPTHVDLQQWERLGGGPEWGPQACAKHIEKIKSTVTLETVQPDNELNTAFVQAAVQAGFRQQALNSSDFQSNFGECVGYFQLNAQGPKRCSSSVAYLHPLDKLPSNLTVRTGTCTKKILLTKDSRGIRASGVLTDSNDPTWQVVHAAREVIVCAGAFDSPKLLLLSGIGPKQHLEKVGVKCAVDLPGVGEHLLDHPEGVIIWELNRPVPEIIRQKYEVGLFAKTQFKDWSDEKGVTDLENGIPDLMFHFGLESFDMNTKLHGYPTCVKAMSLTPNVTKAKSEGTVRLRSANYKDSPVIDFKYFTDPEGHDEAVMVEGIRLARRIAEFPAMRAWIKRELAPGIEVESDEDISAYVRKTANTVYHPAGTCKMGANSDGMAVVDNKLRVRGVGGLAGGRCLHLSQHAEHQPLPHRHAGRREMR
ncbi:Choline oxidase [Balamuthia mandrillaris]